MGRGVGRWIAMVALAASACSFTPRLDAQVESFSTLPRSPAPAQIAVVPFTGLDAASLEFQRYRDRLARALETRGFEVVPAAAEPPWRMRLGYRVDDGRQVVETLAPPPYVYPRAGGRLGRYADPFGYPFGGYPFGGYDVITYTVYGRHVVLVLVDAASGAEVWRASVFNVGRRRTLADVFDAMVEAAFADFPAEVSRRVAVPLAPET
jgi:hypothetical protein